MKRRIACICTLMFVFLFTVAFPARAQSSNSQQTLNQYVSDLQKNPNDYALREKIIRHVQTMRPAPAVPIEAEKFEGRAEFAIKNAKNQSDFLDAAKEYEKALLIAPWVPAYYFNQGIAFEKAGKLKEAKQSFELYLLSAPNAQDARDVRKRIAGLEYAMEKAAKESSPQAIAAKQQNQTEEFFRRIVGARYIWHVNWVDYEETFSVDIYGEKVIFGTTPTRVSRGGVLPSNLSLGVYTELWPCSITKKTMQGGDLVIEVGGCWGMQGYTARNNGGSLTLISTHYKRGYWQNAVFTRSR